MAGKPNPPKEYAKECTGRPSKFTSERRAAIIDDILHHVPYEVAAEANGISHQTLYTWLDIAKQHLCENIESDYTVFLEGIKNAERSRIIEHTSKIASNIEKWQGDAWLLERRWYKHFGSNAHLSDLNERLSKIEHGELNEKASKQASSQEDDKKV